ncbi:hypothetical protein [Microcoleus sp. FACHB-672]|uniref:hypothetical protein n=1 Tax=Microcoleus sp. FACHB-672 TaxID=2692825 RepID=UPI001686504E|nr:hypothetical protein [Microcoleus sp. FACHB-672]MBD2042226.1 hypothetical protein [Microcoleus sp. FACHB-672]
MSFAEYTSSRQPFPCNGYNSRQASPSLISKSSQSPCELKFLPITQFREFLIPESFAMIAKRIMRMWRNWQTRQI